MFVFVRSINQWMNEGILIDEAPFLIFDYCRKILWPVLRFRSWYNVIHIYYTLLFVHNSSSGMILGPESTGSMNTGIWLINQSHEYISMMALCYLVLLRKSYIEEPSLVLPTKYNLWEVLKEAIWPSLFEHIHLKAFSIFHPPARS